MPRDAIDYSKTLIYKIVCKDLTVMDVYTGHTTDFVKRKYSHKNKCNHENNKGYNLKIYQTIRANGGWENWTMVEVEKYPCLDVNEATARERYWLEQFNSTLNIIRRPALTAEERENYYKLYYEKNKEVLVEKGSLYYEKNKALISEKQASYYETNKSVIAKKKALYYEKNKEQINAKQKAKRAEKNKSKTKIQL